MTDDDGGIKLPRVPLSDRNIRLLFRLYQLGGLAVGLVFWGGLVEAKRDIEGPNQLIIPVRYDMAAEAHLYYDVGNGLWHGDLSKVQVSAAADWQVLSFSLPRVPIRSLRFDPMMTDGEFAMQAPWLESRSGRVLARFPPSAVQPWHQIAHWEERGDHFVGRAQRDLTDPQVQLALGEPLRVGLPRWPWVELVALIVWLGAYRRFARHPANAGRSGWRERFRAGTEGCAQAASRFGAGVYRRLLIFENGLNRLLRSDGRKLIVVGAVLVLAAQLFLIRGLGETLDLPMWDEANYAGRGFDWWHDEGALGALHSGPGYVISYGLLSAGHTPAEMVFWQHRVVKIGSLLALYFALVSLGLRWPMATMAALAWGCGWHHLEMPTLIYQAAWIWFLLAICMIRRWPLMSLWAVVWAVAFRQDYQFVLFGLGGLALFGAWRQRGVEQTREQPSRSRRWVQLTLCAGAGLLTFGLLKDVDWGGTGQRGWFAFQQHYAMRVWLECDAPGMNHPFVEYPALIQRDFPGADSLGEALAVNAPAMIDHVAWNFRNALSEVVELWKGHPNLGWVGWGFLLWATVLALGLARPMGSGARSSRRNLVHPIALSAMGLLVAGPAMVVLAKGSYLLPTIPFLLAATFTLLAGLGRRLPHAIRVTLLRLGALGSIAALVALAVSPPVFSPGSRARPVIEKQSALAAIWPEQGQFTLVGFGASSFANYLTLARCRGVEPINAVTGNSSPDRSLAQILEEEAPFAVLVDDGWRSFGEIDEALLSALGASGDWHQRSVGDAMLYWQKRLADP